MKLLFYIKSINYCTSQNLPHDDIQAFLFEEITLIKTFLKFPLWIDKQHLFIC